jgi:hypothetical protein
VIELKSIKNAYIKILKKQCPEIKKIYSIEVEEGYKTPSFFVRIIPLIFRERATISIVKSQCMIETTFFQKEKNESQQLEIAEKIREGIGDYIEVCEEKLRVMDAEIGYTGKAQNIMQFTFNIEFYEDIRQIATEPPIENVSIKEEMTHGDAAN